MRPGYDVLAVQRAGGCADRESSDARQDGVGVNDVDEYTIRNWRAADGSPALQLAGSVLFPGLAMMRRSPLVALFLFVVGVALPVGLAVAVVINRDRIIGIALDRDFLLAVAVLALIAVLARVAAVAEVARLFGGTRFIRSKVSVASFVVGAMGVVAIWVAVLGLEARAAIAEVFGDGSDTPVSAVAGSDDRDDLFTTPVEPDEAESSDTIDDDVVDESETSRTRPVESNPSVTNVLILGADSGPGREGVRTDTMMLVSVHGASGRTSIISIPRNLARLQFPADTPLGDRYPNGYDDLANSLFATVAGSDELTEKYGAYGFDAEPIALASAIGHSLDVQIDDFVVVDMLGFAGVVDAVGGVTVELCQSVSLPPSLPGETPVEPLIGPGEIDMNGVTALAYARTRYADSDYERTGRQRQLMAALGSQVSLVEALQAFRTVTKVLDESLRTSLSVGEFDAMLRRLGENSSIVESVGLVPPLVEPGRPDYDELQAIVADVGRAIVTGIPSGYAPEVAETDRDEPDPCRRAEND